MERPGSQVYLSKEKICCVLFEGFLSAPAKEPAPLTPEVVIVQHGVYKLESSKHCLAALGQQPGPILVAE
jgi:hypothetical protein